MMIYCCGCKAEVEARLTNGSEIYAHREDLYGIPFWICDTCNNFVGCHHKTEDRTRPLGSIPTKEVQKWRCILHRTLDPLWRNLPNYKQKQSKRAELYQKISSYLDETEFHIAEVRDVETAKKVYGFIKDL